MEPGLWGRCGLAAAISGLPSLLARTGLLSKKECGKTLTESKHEITGTRGEIRQSFLGLSILLEDHSGKELPGDTVT